MLLLTLCFSCHTAREGIFNSAVAVHASLNCSIYFMYCLISHSVLTECFPVPGTVLNSGGGVVNMSNSLPLVACGLTGEDKQMYNT